jgi:AcrR family transcriptional regulator
MFWMNVFTKKTRPAAKARPATQRPAGSGGAPARPPAAARRRRGRPRGLTEQGAAARRQLYETAIALIASRGYEATTLRDIAKRAGVSTGLLYRYFPNKRAVILALYDELSAQYAARAAAMPPGTWCARFAFALETSLGVLAPQRATLAALTPVLVGTADEGLFAPGTGFSRRRVQAVFVEAVRGASDAPAPGDAAALGRLLYVVHLAVILWWLFDKTPRQRATRDLRALLAGALPMAALALRLDPARNLVRAADILCREGLFGDDDDPASSEAEKEEA